MAAKSAHARAVYQQVAQQMGHSDPETVVWGVVEGVAAVLDGVKQLPIVGPAASVAKMVKAGIDGSGANTLIDNPYVIGNGLRPSIWKEFKQRFGIETVAELYASSEGNIGFSNFFNMDNTVGFSTAPYKLVKFHDGTRDPVRNA